jgi:hypothetical protein
MEKDEAYRDRGEREKGDRMNMRMPMSFPLGKK